mgnify:CR=1 FL=1
MNIYYSQSGEDEFLNNNYFKKYKIKNIQFESEHSDGTKKRGKKLDELVEYLKNNNYEVIRGPWADHNATLIVNS